MQSRCKLSMNHFFSVCVNWAWVIVRSLGASWTWIIVYSLHVKWSWRFHYFCWRNNITFCIMSAIASDSNSRHTVPPINVFDIDTVLWGVDHHVCMPSVFICPVIACHCVCECYYHWLLSICWTLFGRDIIILTWDWPERGHSVFLWCQGHAHSCPCDLHVVY